MLCESTSHGDLEVCAMRLEVLAENTFHCDVVPLEAVDMLNQAIHLLKSSLNMGRRYEPYQAQSESNVRRRGRPKCSITEEQLIFFRGKVEIWFVNKPPSISVTTCFTCTVSRTIYYVEPSLYLHRPWFYSK